MVAQIEPALLKPRIARKLPRGIVQVFTTPERSFPTDVMVNAMRVASQGNKVLIVQFFQGGIGQGLGSPVKLVENLQWLRADLGRNLDLAAPCLESQERSNILALWSFTAKALASGDYHLLVLDELMELITWDLVPEAVLLGAIEDRSDHTSVVVTGVNVPQTLLAIADQVTHRRIP
ncbi:MAG: cob(I)yrinic acid a,c-diamide adenosyltransferase [Cyanobacteria bacterium KgW148]|nr:cob(I)yrinic acid a,c-diamide adenosyltransferase [Cyanobacteria bacterium KgW148]